MSRQIIGNVFPNQPNQQPKPPILNIKPNIPQPGDNIIVRLGIAIIPNLGNNTNQPLMQLLTPPDERIPILLGSVRTFVDIRRCLRLLLHATMSHHGLLSTNMTHNGLILAANARPQTNGLHGVTDDEDQWRTYINVVTSMYHPPCAQPEICQPCSQPAIIVACFQESFWNQNPGSNIAMRDIYSPEHGMALRRVSTIEEQRYIRLIARLVNPRSGANATLTTSNQSNMPSSQTQSSLTQPVVGDPTKGPKGRSLVGNETKSGRKKDYSKGTIRPANAEQGIKAESDTCLTCIMYNRRCKGTTMKLVATSRGDRKSQWKCDQCRNPQRRCLWRPSADKVTTYEEAFAADGGRALAKNTVEGRKERARKRGATIKDEENSDEEDDAEGGDGDEE